jgi:hypothetical protein
MRYLTLLLTALTSFAVPLANAESTIDITWPRDGSKLFLEPLTIKYKTFLEGDDDHVFIFLDENKIQQMRKARTEYTLERMPLGNHEICIKVAYKDHLLTGQQACVHVTVESPIHVGYGN